ncbi:MAG: TonB-dependent receptor [Gammaproteobacteria bacterium]|nr:TonB-dependent receptor [Gammaproteobacteria bacterium]
MGFDYRRTLASGAAAGVGANFNWSDEIWRNLANSAAILSPSTGFLDAQAYYQTQDQKWRFTVAGRNLTDEVYWYQGVNPFSRFYAQPITWSLTARYEF